jgi:hypothetical protein
MRKIIILAMIALSCVNAEAQYKKASFLNSTGRTYDVGFASRFMGDGMSTMMCIHYSYGKDRGKRLFHWFDLELLLPTKFSYKTYSNDDPNFTSTVSGKTKTGLSYRYNLAGYLTDITKTDAKFKPFATLGINMIIFGATANEVVETPTLIDPNKTPAFNAFSIGANAGLGCLYNFNPKIGMKFTAGYNFQTNTNTGPDSGQETHYSYISHPYITLGVRFTMPERD